MEDVLDIYYRSVGHGATLLLNVSPDNRGLLPDADAARVIEFGDEIRRRFGQPIGRTHGEGSELLLHLDAARSVNHVILMEDIAQGERVRDYVLEAYIQGHWKELVRGSAIGHKKIDRFAAVETAALRLRVLASVEKPMIRSFAAYHVV